MSKKQLKPRVTEQAASAYRLAALFVVVIPGPAIYELMTHHQVGECTDERSYFYPQVAIPLMIVAAIILLKCFQYDYALRNPKYTYKGPGLKDIATISIIVCLFSVAAILVNNFCVPF